MRELLVLPVSAVMKFWHWIFSDLFGLANSAAWVTSIVLLVVTLRLILLPLTWSLYRSGRTNMRMRPEKAAIAEKYANETSPEAAKAEQEELDELHKRYDFNPFAGCIPPLVQFPIILGLLTLIRWMAIPDPQHSAGIGLLTANDIAGFRQAEIFGAPLSAFLSMAPQDLAALGTTEADVRSVLIPMLIFAATFTTINLAISTIRANSQIDYSMKIARGTVKFMFIMTVAMPIIILAIGLTGLLPIAIMLYWVTNNLWTIVQTITLWYLAVKRFPLNDEHRAFNADLRKKVKAEFKAEKDAKKETKQEHRQRRAEAKRDGLSLREVNRQIAEEKKAAAEAKATEKAERKALNKERQKARLEWKRTERQAKLEERKKARAAAKAEETGEAEEPSKQPEQGDSQEPPESSN